MTSMLISGLLVMAYFVAALFFLRFWRQTHDRLFAMFSIAFGILSMKRLALALTYDSIGNAAWPYGLRLLAFLIILAAIVDKNRKPAP